MKERDPQTDAEHNQLTDLPVISDMGKGLEALIGHWQLTWFLCHRHIIQNAGPSSDVGIWVCRLLKTCSPEEYRKQAAIIQLAIQGRYADGDGNLVNTPDNFYIIQEMLNPDSKHPYYARIHWARWLRLGCPTTSNAAESVHGHLNAYVSGISDLIARLKIVIRALQTRYFSRNTWGGTAIRRNQKRLYPSDEDKARPWFRPDKLVFLRELHKFTILV
jgi:hypothetical protein